MRRWGMPEVGTTVPIGLEREFPHECIKAAKSGPQIAQTGRDQRLRGAEWDERNSPFLGPE